MTRKENKISEIKLMSAMRDLKDNDGVSDDVVMSFIYDVYSLISQYRNDFKSEGNDKTTIQDFENAADSIIELAYTIVLGGVHRFELPLNQLKHIKIQFFKTMMSDSTVLSEVFAWNFTILMLNNFRSNQKKAKTSSNN